MISGTLFSRSFTSFWQEHLPLGEVLVRKLNTQHLEHYLPRLESAVAANRRAFVNELAFQLFRHQVENGVSVGKMSQAKLRDFAEQHVGMLAASDDMSRSMSSVELSEAKVLGDRLGGFFAEKERRSTLVISPSIRGSGILDSCYGDVIADGTLYEVKAGQRLFRITDLRQALTYCALNSASGQYHVRQIGLLNPRLGVFVRGSVELMSIEACGMSSNDLFGSIIQFLSTEGASN